MSAATTGLPAAGLAPQVLLPPAPEREAPSNRSSLYAVIMGAALLSAAAAGLSASIGEAPRSLMDKSEYLQLRGQIEADARLKLAECRDSEGSAREICKAQARADERIRKADLEARYRGTIGAEADARLEHAKARYEMARVVCAERSGSERLACLRAAVSEKSKAIAEARPGAPT